MSAPRRPGVSFPRDAGRGAVPLLMGLLAVGGFVSAAERSGEPAPPPKADGIAAEYRIGPQDLLQISVWKNEALSAEVPVRPDGMISLPLLNDVRAAGLTPMELRKTLIDRLAEYVPSPELSVIVKQVRSPKVSIMGEVTHPGRYDLAEETTVLDLLAIAGGLTEFASHSRIVVVRREPAGVRRLRFDYDRALTAGRQENYRLLPGDIVLVR
ncbi:MAG TPA: polysaccharide biosynthesis/export family protein [Candidatus Polarisedimenticolia bacterium]